MSDQSSDTPRAIGSSPRVFPLVHRMIREFGAKTILDCPAGEGPLSQLLLENGYDVTCCDICPDVLNIPDVKCDFGDLNDRLSYPDERFDVVVCLNGLQRVWARGRAVSELARVTKPGGHVIISMPNHGDTRRRILYLLSGSPSWTVVGPPQTCHPDAEVPAAVYRYPMTLANVLSALKSVNMECVSIRATHYAKANLLLAPVGLAISLLSTMWSRKWKDFYYLKQVSSFAAMNGAYLVVTAKKPE